MSSERISDDFTLTKEDMARLEEERKSILEALQEAKEAMSPYENAVDKFVQEKGLNIIKWRMDDPRWTIMSPEYDDWDKIRWTIQMGYSPEHKKLGLVASAHIDREYDVPDGRVHERRSSDSPQKHRIALWPQGTKVNIEELLEKAYERATSFTLRDLTRVSAQILRQEEGELVSREYNPQSSSQA